MKFIVREGKKRGRGPYLAVSHLFDGYVFYHYNRRQGRAVRFDTEKEAEEAAGFTQVKTPFRVVKLKEKD